MACGYLGVSCVCLSFLNDPPPHLRPTIYCGVVPGYTTFTMHATRAWHESFSCPQEMMVILCRLTRFVTLDLSPVTQTITPSCLPKQPSRLHNLARVPTTLRSMPPTCCCRQLPISSCVVYEYRTYRWGESLL